MKKQFETFTKREHSKAVKQHVREDQTCAALKESFSLKENPRKSRDEMIRCREEERFRVNGVRTVLHVTKHTADR